MFLNKFDATSRFDESGSDGDGEVQVISTESELYSDESEAEESGGELEMGFIIREKKKKVAA